MRVTGIDHVYLTVSDFSRSERFYDGVMQALGYRKSDKRISDEPHAHYIHPLMQISIRPAHSGVRHDPYAPGLHHLCLQVSAKSDVDEAHRRLAALGVGASAPGVYPEYTTEYYATFFQDPDGLRLEVVARTQYRRDLARFWPELDEFLNPLAAFNARRGAPATGGAIGLRRCGPSDLAEVRALVREYHLEAGVPHDEATIDATLAPLLDGSAGRIWTIERANETIGYVAVCLGYSIELGGRDAFVDEIWVTPSERGRGVGEAALHEAEREARTLGVRALHLEVDEDNAAARRLYERLGFRPRTPYRLMSKQAGMGR